MAEPFLFSVFKHCPIAEFALKIWTILCLEPWRDTRIQDSNWTGFVYLNCSDWEKEVFFLLGKEFFVIKLLNPATFNIFAVLIKFIFLNCVHIDYHATNSTVMLSKT